MAKTLEERLGEQEQDEALVRLRDKVVGDVRRSRTKMSERYKIWDHHNDIYRGVRPRDKEDMDAKDHDEPEKMVVPMTFAQVQTFAAFCFMLYTQNNRFFEMAPTGAEDYEIVNDLEEVLERDLRRNCFPRILYQLLLDTGRFGIGVVKHWWAQEKQYASVNVGSQVDNVDGFGFTSAPTTEMKEFIKYEGNRIQNISPYNFFPDSRFPLAEWKKGAFCADETEWHINQLKEWQRDGLAFGVEHIEPMSKDEVSKRGTTRLDAFEKFSHQAASKKDEDDQIVCVTEYQSRLRPVDYELGEEDRPMWYTARVANDQRVISARPLGYMHDEWNYDMMQFSPDIHQKVGDSLADVISAMQDVVSYMINTRLASVRKSLQSNLIIDPASVNMSTVESRSPFILMSKSSPRLGVDKFVRQLNFVDTTQNHLNDADFMLRFMQIVTGVNENAMGQVHPGRRSATENRAANQGASSRMKVIAAVGWSDCLASLGRKMMINLRQGLGPESFVKILGPTAAPRYEQFAPVDKTMLIGAEDHFIFDSTLQSEKGFLAQSLQELVGAILSNPIVMQVLPLDVAKIMEEILILRGVDNIERFRLPDGSPGFIPELQQLGPSAGPNGDSPVSQRQTVPAP